MGARWFGLLALLLISFLAIGSSPASASSVPPRSLTLVSGSGQKGWTGTTLALPLKALVAPTPPIVDKVLTTFQIVSGGGSLKRSPGAPSGGTAIAVAGASPEAFLVLPATAGVVTVKASTPGAGAVYFTAAAISTQVGDPLTDADGDGVPDAQEVAEGTDPTDPASNSTALLGLAVLTPLREMRITPAAAP